MSPTLKTLMLAIVAAATSAGAAYFYPWPQAVVQSEIVGKPLFEDYEANLVRRIRIQRYDSSKGGLTQLEVRRQGDTWVLPGYKNFPATNLNQTILTLNALVERDVLDEATDRAEDHREFGVVDPGLYESMPNRSALGTKMILEGSTGNVMANLIIGSRVGDSRPNARGEEQRFVNIPGQPTVYVIELDPDALVTDFESWVEPNLFALPRVSDDRNIDVREIQVRNSRRDPEQLASATPERISLATVTLTPTASGGVNLEFTSLKTGSPTGEWMEVGTPSSLSPEIQEMVNQLPQIPFGDVRKLPRETSRLLRPLEWQGDLTPLDSLQPYGFALATEGTFANALVSAAGRVELKFTDGVVLSMLIGNIATDASDQTELSRYVLFRASFDESFLEPAPEAPIADEDPEIAEQQNKAYLREMQARNERIKYAKQFVASFRNRNAEWIYLVPDSVVSRLQPDLDLTGIKANIPATDKEPAENEPAEEEPSARDSGDPPSEARPPAGNDQADGQ